MKAILLLTILCIAQNCSNKKSVYNDSICRDTYPTLIDSLNVSDLYDNAKWSLYTWNCDKVYLPKGENKENTFGVLSLEFKSCLIKSDTIEFFFDFVDKSSIPLWTKKICLLYRWCSIQCCYQKETILNFQDWLFDK